MHALIVSVEYMYSGMKRDAANTYWNKFQLVSFIFSSHSRRVASHYLPVRRTHPVIHPSPTVEPSTTMMSPAMKEIVLLPHLPFAHSSARVGDFCTSELKPMAINDFAEV